LRECFQIRRLLDATRCLQIVIQPIQVDQRRTIILGQRAGRVGETGTGEESVVHLVN
jgi:hypothetical protein